MLRIIVWIQLSSGSALARRVLLTPWKGVAREEGQTTAEYALVILAAAAIAVVLIAWAKSSGKLPAFFDHIIDDVTGSAG